MGAAVSIIPDAFARVAAHEAQRAAANFNMDELARSSALEQANAAFAEQTGAMQAGLARQRGSAVEAQQRVAWASAGIDTSTGTPAAVGEGSRLWAELDAQTLQNNARRVAMGHRETSRRYEAERNRLVERWQAPGSAFGSPADLEFFGTLSARGAASAVEAALSSGIGGF